MTTTNDHNLTIEQVEQVGRTGNPLTINGWVLSFDQLIGHSTSRDWDGMYLQLTTLGARRVTDTLNASQPWRT